MANETEQANTADFGITTEQQAQDAEVAAKEAAPPPQPRGQRVSDEELTHRYTYHAPSGAARQAHEQVRAEFRWFASFINNILPEGRSKSLAHTALEEASFHAHAAIAREPSLHDDPV